MIRFRSEIPFGEGYRNILDVLVYETYSLGNNDILIYLKDNYLEGTLKEECESLINQFEEDYLSEEIFKEFYEKAILFLNKKENKNLKYCLWLADKEVVKNYYGNRELNDEDIDAYETSDIILTDLGYDGTLYAYEYLPRPL